MKSTKLVTILGLALLGLNIGCAEGFKSNMVTSSLSSSAPPPAAETRQNIQTIEVSATDNVGVTKVEVFIDGNLKCTLTSSPYKCDWPVEGEQNQEVVLVAKAYDAKGNVGESAPVKVTLQ